MASYPKHFDTLGYVKGSKELGISEQVAEYQARQIEQAVDIAISSNREELATKSDIKELELKVKENETKIEQSKNEIIKDVKELELKIKEVETKIEQSKSQIIIWVLGFFVASGLITHFFK